MSSSPRSRRPKRLAESSVEGGSGRHIQAPMQVHEPHAAVSLGDILPIITSRRLLHSPDLARLLWLTSKSLTQSVIMEDDNNDGVYKLLCFNRWGEAQTQVLLDATGLTHKVYFLQLWHSSVTAAVGDSSPTVPTKRLCSNRGGTRRI